ncbi:hypothetical protein FRC14_000603 [Serendipita sp. 396]|nr:hypothetical protein FRC14_000603 [Serendipita sp. 396]KAG8780913.1 hypothetical protein FRC15_009172 [Serendipita sp. 397]KAG8797107.1 hypothetical protein FRC16_009220 [Serendipita sp. 398]KAG8816376.1 hypothetical protein FRC19_000405 [Serendipita sp. 401]KAG8862519.1 hypothetical protein FRC20_011202 [Serendipita sp. 405]KAG9042704.1 hypothetical protein FS842_002094 [Serendipita sp. 407]
MLELPQLATQNCPLADATSNEERAARRDLFSSVDYEFFEREKILPIADKYLMTTIERKGIQCLLKDDDCDVFLIWMTKLGQEIDSTELYERAIEGLVNGAMPMGDEVREIGFKAFYEVTLRRELKRKSRHALVILY